MFLWILREVRVRIPFLIYSLESLFGVLNMRKLIILMFLCPALFCCCRKDDEQNINFEPSPPALMQDNNLPQIGGALALSVGNDTVTSSEVVRRFSGTLRELALKSRWENFQKEAGPRVEQFIINSISNILLYNEAKKDAGDVIDDRLEKAVDSEVKRFASDYGGDYAAAQEALKRGGFDGWQDYKDFQRRFILSQSYLSSKLPEQKPVTYNEILDRYNQLKDSVYTAEGKIAFQLIDIQPAAMKILDPNKDVRSAAMELAKDLLERAKSGEDFGELAKKYSQDPWAQFGGQWKPLNPQSLAQPYDILAQQSEKMSIGEIAEPIETDGHIFIMKLTEKTDRKVKPLPEVQKEIQKTIIAERNRAAMEKISRQIVQNASIPEKDEFITFCLKKIYQANRQ
jgi:parvulin-like peptidyl-prolyl isomerase